MAHSNLIFTLLYINKYIVPEAIEPLFLENITKHSLLAKTIIETKNEKRENQTREFVSFTSMVTMVTNVHKLSNFHLDFH